MDTVVRAVWPLEAAPRATAGRAPVVHDARSGVAPPQAAGAPQKAMSTSQSEVHLNHGPSRLLREEGSRLGKFRQRKCNTTRAAAARSDEPRATSTQGRTLGSKHVAILRCSCRLFLPDDDHIKVVSIWLGLVFGLRLLPNLPESGPRMNCSLLNFAGLGRNRTQSRRTLSHLFSRIRDDGQ